MGHQKKAYLMIKRLRSISGIQKVFDTSRSPVVVMADDFNEYVCKHSRNVPANYLCYELISNKFLKLWGLDVPEATIMDVNPDHLKANQYSGNLQPSNFFIPAVGFRYLHDSIDVNQLVVTKYSRQTKKLFAKKERLLKIALFDIWMANEDRNQNNYNLLIVNDAGKGFNLVPIDHEMVFNTGNLERGLVEITQEESLITSMLFNTLIMKQPGGKIVDLVLIIKNEFYLCIEKCYEQLDEILEDMPPAWQIDVPAMKALLIQNLFSEKWKQRAFNQFTYLIQKQTQ